MYWKSALSVLLVLAFIAAAGCTGTTPATTPASTATPAGTQAPTQQATVALTAGSTDVVPDYNLVTVDVGEKEFDGKIPVTFRGGKGLVHTKKIDVTITRADGSTESATVGIKVGDEISLQGTRGEPGMEGNADRVEVWVTFDTGMKYKVADVLRVYRSRM
jgi:hypothetical protein